MTDYEYCVNLTNTQTSQAIQELSSLCSQSNIKKINMQACKDLAEKCRSSLTQNASTGYDPTPNIIISIVKGDTVEHELYELRGQNPCNTLNKAFTLKFPTKFIDILMEENLIDANIANQWILEYRKYLCLVYHSKERLEPCYKVKVVWHLHMTYTQHYRYSCIALLNKHLEPEPIYGGKFNYELSKSFS